jgi:hypothetical protein
MSQPKPTELAEELLRLREAAMPGEWIESQEQPEWRNYVQGNMAFVCFAANHAQELAQALLDADAKSNRQSGCIKILEKEVDDLESEKGVLEAQILLITNQASSLEAKLKDCVAALEWYANQLIYQGANQNAIDGMPSRNGGYLLDATFDGGQLARETLARVKDGK